MGGNDPVRGGEREITYCGTVVTYLAFPLLWHIRGPRARYWGRLPYASKLHVQPGTTEMVSW